MTEQPQTRPLAQGGAARSAGVQEAIGVAATVAQAGVPVGAAEEQVLGRIVGQRQRVADRARAAAMRPSLANAVLRGQGQVGAHVRTSVESHPLFVAGRDAVLRHPVSIGFALGAGLVLGPRRLVRAAVLAAPWLVRGWRLVERTRSGLRTTRRR